MNTPVLLLAYNRPAHTRRVLERLKEWNATAIYVSVDGPKNAEDKIACAKVTELLNEFAECIVSTRNSNINLGCKTAVIEGINWFFGLVEEGIILEDDCLPNTTFFEFTTDLLNRYRHNPRVHMISGNNPLGSWEANGNHFFSRVGHIWGWATWKNRWSAFNPKLPQFDQFVHKLGFERAFGPTKLAKNRELLTRYSVEGKIDTWDYQWNAHMLMKGGIAAIPSRNLVKNIGFDDEGTHTKIKPNWIANEAFADTLTLDSTELNPDREYEMSLFLAQRANLASRSSVLSFQNQGASNLNKLKVVLINTSDIGGGAEKIVFELHSKLLELGHTSTLLVATKKSDYSGVELIRADWEKQVSVINADVIHVHNLHGTVISLDRLVKFSSTAKILYTMHDSWLTTGSEQHPFMLNPSTLSFLELRAWSALLTDRKTFISNCNIRFTTPSQWLRERFFFSHRIRPFYVPNAVNPVLEKHVEIPSQRYILFIANRPETNPYKDFDTLRLAWIEANRMTKDPVDLVCIGASENSKNQVGNGTIFLIQKQSFAAVAKFIQSSLFVVQASKQDNSPLAIIEAHQNEKMVVGSLVGGIPELMNSTEQKLLYEPRNVESLTTSLNRLIEMLDSQSDLENLPLHSTIEPMAYTYLGHYLDMQNG